MGESKDILLLEKFLAGTITPEEEAWLREWADTTLSQPGALDLLRASRSSAKLPDPSLDREARWLSLRQKIAASAIEPHATQKTESHTRRAVFPNSWTVLTSRVPVVARVACVAAVFFVAAWLIRSHIAAPSHETIHEYATARGQRAVIRLPDGTTATLAPGTQLRLSISEPTGLRRVDLDGEAFFAVESNRTAPFIVHAGNTITKVLGTGFGVRRYPGDSAVRVAVASGRVAVQSTVAAPNAKVDDELSARNSHAVILAANDVAQVRTNGVAQVQHDADLNDELSWRTGRYSFRMASAATIATELSRAYDLDIRIPDPALGRQLLTLSFATDRESAMLDIFVSALLDARMERHGRTVTITRVTR